VALTFPAPLPSMSFTRTEFWLEHQQSTSLTGGGNPAAASLAPPLWRARFQTPRLGDADAGTWTAWISALRGGLRMFKGVPRRWPITYPAGFAGLTVGGSPFSGSGSISAIATSRDQISISGLPAGFVLQAGDYLSVPSASRQLLHLVTESGTANGSGVASVSIEPVLRQGITTGAAVLAASPWCEMVLIGSPVVARDTLRLGTLQFEGRQVLI